MVLVVVAWPLCSYITSLIGLIHLWVIRGYYVCVVLGVDWPSLESVWPAISEATRAFVNKITEIVFLKKMAVCKCGKNPRFHAGGKGMHFLETHDFKGWTTILPNVVFLEIVFSLAPYQNRNLFKPYILKLLNQTNT